MGSEMCIRDSYRPERPNPGVPGRGHCRTKRPRPGVHGRGHYRPERPRPGVPGRGHCRSRFPERLPTGWRSRLLILLSNTPQTMCCSGSPVLLFAVVAFVVYRRRRVIFLRGAVYDGGIGQASIAQWSSSCPPIQAHTNAAAEACADIDSAAWDREKQHAVLSGKYVRSTQNPAMKHRLLSTGNKRLAEASPMDPVWGIGLRADDPRAKSPRQWRGKILLGEALSAVRGEIRDTKTGLANPASAGWFRISMGNA